MASDVADGFLQTLAAKRMKLMKFNVLTDDFPQKYDGVLAWRVFVHFTREDIAEALARIYAALPAGGRFMFNVIDRATHDCDSEMKDSKGEYFLGAERYYAYYTEKEMLDLINKTDFRIVKEWHKTGGYNEWLCYVLER